MGAGLGQDEASEGLQDTACRAWALMKDVPGKHEAFRQRVLPANLYRPHRQACVSPPQASLRLSPAAWEPGLWVAI